MNIKSNGKSRTNFVACKSPAPAAFTLIELLTVLAVIGLIVALVLAATSRGMAMARKAHCASNLRQIGLAMQMFVADKHSYPLVAIDYPDHYTGWERQLSNAELDGAPAFGAAGRLYPPPGIWHCPAAWNLEAFPTYRDYGYNVYGMSPLQSADALGLGGHHIWTSYEHQPAPPVSDSEVAVPSDMIALGDGFHGADGVINDGWHYLWRAAAVTNQPELFAGGTSRAYSRHFGKANIFFCDGHVESLKLKILFVDNSDKALSKWNRDHQPHRELAQ